MNGIENFQYGKSNLFKYRGVRCGQVFGVHEKFTREFLSLFDRIIELGTHRGGFSYYLRDHCEGEIYSYDIKCHLSSFGTSVACQNEASINFVVKDIFHPETQKEIISLLQTEGRVLLLCDGGQKERELEIFSEYLKPNDVVMLHDYEHNAEQMAALRNKINWHFESESFRSRIDNIIRQHDLHEFKYQSFCDVLWGSFIKGCGNGKI